MGRYVTQFGPAAPDVPMFKTLEVDTTYKPSEPYGGLPTEMFRFDAYPWLWRSSVDDNATEDPSVGRYVSTLQQAHLGKTKIKTVPAESDSQLVINRESQYYVRRHEQQDPANNLPELVYTGSDNAIHFRTIRTPVEFQEKALGNLDSFEIVSINTSALEIRVKGGVYDRKEPSDDGAYDTGKYIGMEKFLRDTLDSDSGNELNLSWQLQKYAYGHAKFLEGNQRVTYDRIIDENAIDPPESSGATTYHRIRLRTPPTSWPSVGSRIQLYRHLPFCSGMLTTTQTFSQKYWMIECETELSDSLYQFFAVFGWNHYMETTDGISFPEAEKSGEIDVLENPAADIRWRFHNAHAPTGGQLNMAVNEGRTPVIDNPEWDENYKQQHQLASSFGPNYGNRVTFRQYWWPEDNEYGKPGNSLEWYIKDTDGVFKRVGGCLAPSFWANGIIDEKQIFINAAAYGDFTRGLNFSYGGGPTSAPKTTDFVSKVYKFEVYQFAYQRAGGSGIPTSSGTYPLGLGPTPGDISGGSGAGIVSADATTATGGGAGELPDTGTGTGSGGGEVVSPPSTITRRKDAFLSYAPDLGNGQIRTVVAELPINEDGTSANPDDYTYKWTAGAGVTFIGPKDQYKVDYEFDEIDEGESVQRRVYLVYEPKDGTEPTEVPSIESVTVEGGYKLAGGAKIKDVSISNGFKVKR